MCSAIFAVIILVLDIWAIAKIWTSAHTGTAKVLWTAIIVVFPVGGLILYAFFGRAPEIQPPAEGAEDKS